LEVIWMLSDRESFGAGDLLPREAARRRVRSAKLDLHQVADSRLMFRELNAGEQARVLQCAQLLHELEVSLGG
jgi:hypothetical protein